MLGALGLFFLIKGYDTGKLRFGLSAVCLTCLGLFFKEPAIALVIAIGIIALADWVIIKVNVRMSSIVALTVFGICLIFYFFVKTIRQGYSEAYKLTITSIMNGVSAYPLIIKIIALLSSCLIIKIFYDYGVKNRNASDVLKKTMFPIFVMSYLGVYLPWKELPFYVLSFLAPFIIGIIYYYSSLLSAKIKFGQNILRWGVLLVCTVCLFGLILPRIELMASNQKLIDCTGVIAQKEGEVIFYFPKMKNNVLNDLKFFNRHYSNVQFISINKISSQDKSFSQNSYLILNKDFNEIWLDKIKVDQGFFKIFIGCQKFFKDAADQEFF